MSQTQTQTQPNLTSQSGNDGGGSDGNSNVNSQAQSAPLSTAGTNPSPSPNNAQPINSSTAMSATGTVGQLGSSLSSTMPGSSPHSSNNASMMSYASTGIRNLAGSLFGPSVTNLIGPRYPASPYQLGTPRKGTSAVNTSVEIGRAHV